MRYQLIPLAAALVVYPLYADDLGETVLPEITVKASRPNAEQIGRSVLNNEQIRQQQADNAASLIERLPGVSMGGSPRPSGQNLNIWGFQDSEDIKITIDGAPKNFERYRQGTIFIEPELLKQVEADKGNFDPARGGNGGFGGAVKLQTLDAHEFLAPDERLGGLLKAAYHSNDEQHQYTGALFMQNKAHTADALFYGTWRGGGDITRPDGEKYRYSENQQQSWLLKANYQPNEAHLIGLSIVRGTHKAWEPFASMRGDLPAPSVSDIQRYGEEGAWLRKLVYRNQTDQSYSLKYRYAPENPLWDLSLNLYHAQTMQHDKRPANASRFSAASMGNESETEYRDTGFNVSNIARWRNDTWQHTLTTGLQINHHQRDVEMTDLSKTKNDRYNYGIYQPAYMPAGRQRQYSFYLQDNIQLGQWQISPALRYDWVRNQGIPNLASIYNDASAGHDYQSKIYSDLSYYLNVNWQPSPNWLFFAGASRAWRAPVIDEQYEVQYAQSSVTATSRYLLPERLSSYRLGGMLSKQNWLAHDDKLQVRATLFHTRGQDEIFRRRGVLCYEELASQSSSSCARPMSNYRNLPGYRINGFELEAYYQMPRWFASLNYSAMYGKRLASPRNPWFERETWMAEIPPQTLSTSLGVRFPAQGLTLGWRGQFVRKQNRSPVQQDPDAGYWSLPQAAGYGLHHVFATWQPPQVKNLTLRLAVDNVFNKSYRPYLSESVEGVGRNVKLSISKQF